MIEKISSYLASNNDIYAPLEPNDSLAQYDPYRIYTLVCIDKLFQTKTVEYYQSNSKGFLTKMNNSSNINELIPYSSPKTTNVQSYDTMDAFLAIQSFSPFVIPINFLEYVNTYHGQ